MPVTFYRDDYVVLTLFEVVHRVVGLLYPPLGDTVDSAVPQVHPTTFHKHAPRILAMHNVCILLQLLLNVVHWLGCVLVNMLWVTV